MDDPNQIEVPPSFLALYSTPTGHRLTEPMSTVRERYELCEDLAQLVTEQAATAQFKSGGSEREVLEKIQLALSAEDSPVTPAEAEWVVRRAAELLDWKMH
ncbi:MAG: hypothetical protein AVDCRST_MAG51-2467 [uncultured Ramlibacter sp.]|uniref:ATPase with chaperone activity n=1 Tax=uncultured Ramlibacter sp. TaxID=260755 RepID=A0A6J4Q2H7_9BURK|nr:MAG: hypothetical protein AVDCRST_MAG51-2467 [uncultured Ramlibacter sp.]